MSRTGTVTTAAATARRRFPAAKSRAAQAAFTADHAPGIAVAPFGAAAG